MRFFKLTHPRYATDRETDRRNPVTATATYRIPGVSCDACGNWSSSSRLRVPLPHDAEEFRRVEFLPVAEWNGLRDRWAYLLGVDPSRIEPGAQLGPPTGSRSGAVTEDVVHPFPGLIWVVPSVRAALVEAGLSGVSFAGVQLEPSAGDEGLSELVVRGSAWRKASTDQVLRVCGVCERRGYPSPKNLTVDEARWDGSDFVLLDRNPNIVVVTARVAEVFDARSFTNVVAEPIG